MKTKFIGLEGFNEIESLSGKNIKCSGKSKNAARKNQQKSTAHKTVRFVKRAVTLLGKKTKLVSVHMANSAAESAKARKAKKAAAQAKKRHAHSAPKEYREHTFIKKRAVLAFAACTTAIVLSCVTVAGALDVTSAPEAGTAKVEATTSPAEKPAAITATTASNGESEYTLEAGELIVSSRLTSLYVDGEKIGTTSDGDKLNAALNNYLTDYRKDYDDTTVTEFANDVRLVSETEDVKDTLTVEQLMAEAEDKFSVSLSTDWSYDLDIDYDVDVTYDEDEDSDYEKVITEGETGICRVNVRLKYVDGAFVSSELIDTKTVKEPVAEEVIRGAKQGKAEEKSSGTTGSFIWPAPHTRGITTYFEMRWGSMHNGIDIAGGGDYGQPILASDGGIVTFSGYDDSGYGNYVIIDHGNGYETLYGHASELAVSAGQYVNQGDTVAYIGSTGFSTGPHLHFEIRINGEKVDPLDYVS